MTAVNWILKKYYIWKNSNPKTHIMLNQPQQEVSTFHAHYLNIIPK
jgi:hypothetical protein